MILIFNLNIYVQKVFLHVFLFFTVLILFYYAFITSDIIRDKYNLQYENNIKYISTIKLPYKSTMAPDSDYDVWITFTKVNNKSPLTVKLYSLIHTMLVLTSVPLKFHVIVDDRSQKIAENIIIDLSIKTATRVEYTFYNISTVATSIKDIVAVMTPHFSSVPGTYYSDALFYLSIGLHRIAPKNQTKAVMLDCDLMFKKDIALLFEEFNNFKPTTLFALAPELSPVYRHVLYKYRTKYNTTFGEPLNSMDKKDSHNQKGFPGYNSGVILFNFSAIRESEMYAKLLTNQSVNDLTEKYSFHGHLGDQDFYTLIGYEHPELIYSLNCGYNRQLCLWWRNVGYKYIFDYYFKCGHTPIVLHGNCNTKIPKR